MSQINKKQDIFYEPQKVIYENHFTSLKEQFEKYYLENFQFFAQTQKQVTMIFLNLEQNIQEENVFYEVIPQDMLENAQQKLASQDQEERDKITYLQQIQNVLRNYRNVIQQNKNVYENLQRQNDFIDVFDSDQEKIIEKFKKREIEEIRLGDDIHVLKDELQSVIQILGKSQNIIRSIKEVSLHFPISVDQLQECLEEFKHEKPNKDKIERYRKACLKSLQNFNQIVKIFIDNPDTLNETESLEKFSENFQKKFTDSKNLFNKYFASLYYFRKSYEEQLMQISQQFVQKIIVKLEFFRIFVFIKNFSNPIVQKIEENIQILSQDLDNQPWQQIEISSFAKITDNIQKTKLLIQYCFSLINSKKSEISEFNVPNLEESINQMQQELNLKQQRIEFYEETLNFLMLTLQDFQNYMDISKKLKLTNFNSMNDSEARQFNQDYLNFCTQFQKLNKTLQFNKKINLEYWKNFSKQLEQDEHQIPLLKKKFLTSS